MTYGDMMSLLLCFFIMLVAMSEIKQEKFEKTAEAIKSAFALSTFGGGWVLSPVFDEAQRRQATEEKPSKNDDQGIEGTTTTVKQVREGILEPVGGPISFEPGSAELTDEGKRKIAALVPRIKGETNKIEVRGHASSVELVHGSTYTDLWTLSYDRARAVMAYLISDEVGIRQDRIRLSANADNEPLKHRVYLAGILEPNRRVEIIVMEAIVDDFTKPEIDTGP